MFDGREPVSLEGTTFNAMVEWLRLYIVALGLIGLFCAIFVISVEDQRQSRQAQRARNNSEEKPDAQSQEALNVRSTLRNLVKSLSQNGCPRHDDRIKLVGRRNIQYLQATAENSQENDDEAQSLIDKKRQETDDTDNGAAAAYSTASSHSFE